MQIFVSHSRKKSHVEAKIFDLVLDRLAKRGIFSLTDPRLLNDQILIDSSLVGGELWRRRLYHWLFEADHGIIFCTKVEGADHIAEMRNWLYTEATALALRLHVGALRSILVICAGIEFKNHPFKSLDALQLDEIQTIEIHDPDDAQARQAVDLAMDRAYRGGSSVSTHHATTLDEDRKRLANWLETFGTDAKRRNVHRHALKTLRVDGAPGTSPIITPQQHYALALRLIEGPMAAPPDFVAAPPNNRPYGDLHITQWSELLRWRKTPIDIELVDKITTTWVGIQRAVELGHHITQRKRVFHICIEECDDYDDTQCDADARMQLLKTLLAASGWIWFDKDIEHLRRPDALDIALTFRFLHGERASRHAVIRTTSTNDEDEFHGLVNKVLMLRKSNHSAPAATENPIVVADPSGLFLADKTLDVARIQTFIDQCDGAVNVRRPWRCPPWLLFIVSYGGCLSQDLPNDWLEISIPFDDWLAAADLYLVRTKYIQTEKTGGNGRAA